MAQTCHLQFSIQKYELEKGREGANICVLVLSFLSKCQYDDNDLSLSLMSDCLLNYLLFDMLFRMQLNRNGSLKFTHAVMVDTID